MTERDSLLRIKRLYGDIIVAAVEEYRIRAEVVGAIIQRETAGGLSPYLDIRGPEGRGDGGHGHGLMQIDDRSFPEFCSSVDWMQPEANIRFGTKILARKRSYIRSKTVGIGFTEPELERAAIAAYNCGEGNVMKSIRAGEDVDTRTANQNYSADVLRMADVYLQLTSGNAGGV